MHANKSYNINPYVYLQEWKFGNVYMYIMNVLNHELPQRKWNQSFQKKWAFPAPHVSHVTIYATYLETSHMS